MFKKTPLLTAADIHAMTPEEINNLNKSLSRAIVKKIVVQSAIVIGAVVVLNRLAKNSETTEESFYA